MMDEPNPGKVLLSGGSGMLGSAISRALRGQGASLLRLVRNEPTGPQELQWNPAAGELDSAPLEGLDAAVHLSGASVAAKRWSADYKREMWESRVGTTELLSRTLAKLARPPRVLV